MPGPPLYLYRPLPFHTVGADSISARAPSPLRPTNPRVALLYSLYVRVVRGILPRPKNSPQGCFCPAGRGRGVATCGYRIRLRPLGGACLLRPLRLLRLPVSAAGGGRLHSKPFSSSMVHKRQFPQKQAIKNTPQLRARYFVVHHRGLEPRTH